MRWTDGDLDTVIRRGVKLAVGAEPSSSVIAGATRRRPERREESHQIAYIEWCGLTRIKTGEHLSDFVIAIPNGGFRTYYEAARFKAAGVQAGFPDLELVLATATYHALHIEMKADKNQPTDKQLAWHTRLRACGRKVVVCWTWNEAARETISYLGSDRVYAPLTEYVP